MFENKCMFDVLDPETGKYGNRFHLASIVGLLGPPPLEFLQRSGCSSVYFDDRGKYLILRICMHSPTLHANDRQLEVSEYCPIGVLGRFTEESRGCQ